MHAYVIYCFDTKDKLQELNAKLLLVKGKKCEELFINIPRFKIWYGWNEIV